jgi:hypothetical protein
VATTEARPKKFGTDAVMLGVVFASMMLSLFLPIGWDRHAGPFAPLVRLMTLIVPAIEKYAVASPHAGVIETQLSIIWACVFATAFPLLFRSYQLDRISQLPRKNRWIVVSLLGAFFPGVFVVMYFGMPITQHDLTANSFPGQIFKVITKSRVGLGIFGAATYILCVTYIVLIVVTARNFVRLWFK